MIGGIIVTHAGFGVGLQEAVEMIAGKQSALCAVALQEGDGLDILMERIQSSVQMMECDAYVIFVDMFGATPCNAACVLCAQLGYFVAAGVNLPLLLEFVTSREHVSIEELKISLHATSVQAYRWIDQFELL